MQEGVTEISGKVVGLMAMAIIQRKPVLKGTTGVTPNRTVSLQNMDVKSVSAKIMQSASFLQK